MSCLKHCCHTHTVPASLHESNIEAICNEGIGHMASHRYSCYNQKGGATPSQSSPHANKFSVILSWPSFAFWIEGKKYLFSSWSVLKDEEGSKKMMLCTEKVFILHHLMLLNGVSFSTARLELILEALKPPIDRGKFWQDGGRIELVFHTHVAQLHPDPVQGNVIRLGPPGVWYSRGQTRYYCQINVPLMFKAWWECLRRVKNIRKIFFVSNE